MGFRDEPLRQRVRGRQVEELTLDDGRINMAVLIHLAM